MKKTTLLQKRDFNMLLQARREINLRTRSSTMGKKKYSRKKKHKKDCWNEFSIRAHSSNLAA